jgi:uncharacterized protein
MDIRPLGPSDESALQALLMREPARNAFHLSMLQEQGLPPVSHAAEATWAVGAFRGRELVGAAMALRGTGGLYHEPGDVETLEPLAHTIEDKVMARSMSLLSGHTSQVGPALPMLNSVMIGWYDRCHFRTLYPLDLRYLEKVESFPGPRVATWDDMERLVDFYMTGFYSLARLPSREAWRARLSEQLTYRTLFLIEDGRGRVLSAALSSAEGGRAAMLGGVATVDEYRGRGLSAACVGALCHYLFGKGIESVSLFYLLGNEPAGRVYDKLGFSDGGEWLLVPLGR